MTCVALHDYTAQEDNELTFKKGDVIVDCDSEDDPDGWWCGRIGENRGLFPHTWVKVITPSGSASAPAAKPADGDAAASAGGEPGDGGTLKRKGMVGAVQMPGGIGFNPGAVQLKKTTTTLK
jgi:hypothetical protein